MTALEIINYALDRLGAQPATSLADTGRNAKIAIRNYALVRDKALRLYEWPSLIKRAALVASEAAGLALLPYAYDVPDDCFRVIECSNGGKPVEYRMEGTVLYLKVDSAEVKYIKKSEDPTDWDPLLRSAIGLLLASEIADAITGNDSKKAPLYQEFMQVVTIATAVNNSEAVSDTTGAFSWVE